MEGGNLFTSSRILGHANPKITLDRYAHMSPQFITEQRQTMDKAYFPVGMDTEWTLWGLRERFLAVRHPATARKNGGPGLT